MMFDMQSLSVFANRKASAAAISEHDCTDNERISLSDPFVRKAFRRHFERYQLSSPEDKVHNSKVLERATRWFSANGCAALASGDAYVLCTPSGTLAVSGGPSAPGQPFMQPGSAPQPPPASVPEQGDAQDLQQGMHAPAAPSPSTSEVAAALRAAAGF